MTGGAATVGECEEREVGETSACTCITPFHLRHAYTRCLSQSRLDSLQLLGLPILKGRRRRHKGLSDGSDGDTVGMGQLDERLDVVGCVLGVVDQNLDVFAGNLLLYPSLIGGGDVRALRDSLQVRVGRDEIEPKGGRE